MNGIHDMGGMQGFGPVVAEQNEPIFHSPWERGVFASFAQLAAQGLFNLDEFRHAIERMGNEHYLEASYYEHWLGAFEALLTEKGIVDGDELRRRTSRLKADPTAFPPPPARGDEKLAPLMKVVIEKGGPTSREVASPPRFRVGDRVRARVMSPPGHTRLPRYVRGKTGVVEIVHGAFVFPDTNAHLRGEKPQHVYAVRFEATEVWGEPAAAGPGSVYVDLWEDYLEPAG